MPSSPKFYHMYRQRGLNPLLLLETPKLSAGKDCQVKRVFIVYAGHRYQNPLQLSPFCTEYFKTKECAKPVSSEL